MTQPTNELDLVWGAAAIAALMGCTERKVFHMLEAGEIPCARQIGRRWVVSRRKLLELFEGAAA